MSSGEKATGRGTQGQEASEAESGCSPEESQMWLLAFAFDFNFVGEWMRHSAVLLCLRSQQSCLPHCLSQSQPLTPLAGQPLAWPQFQHALAT